MPQSSQWRSEPYKGKGKGKKGKQGCRGGCQQLAVAPEMSDTGSPKSPPDARVSPAPSSAPL